jgi:hypothetical protein
MQVGLLAVKLLAVDASSVKMHTHTSAPHFLNKQKSPKIPHSRELANFISSFKAMYFFKRFFVLRKTVLQEDACRRSMSSNAQPAASKEASPGAVKSVSTTQKAKNPFVRAC